MGTRILHIVRQTRIPRLFSRHNGTHSRSFAYVGATGLLVATMGAVGFATRSDNTNTDNEPSDTAASVPRDNTPTSPTPSHTIISESSTSSADDSSSASSHTSITVNNQSIEVPENGSTQQTIVNQDGSRVDVSIDNQSVTSSSNSSSTTTHLHINSFSANTSVQFQHQNKTDISSD